MARIARLLVATGLLVALLPGASPAQEGGGTTGLEESCRLIRGQDTPDVPEDDVTVCRQDVWFRQATTKAGNLAAFGYDEFPTWDTEEPTASFATGSGGGYLGTSTFHQATAPWDPRGTAVFEGSFTGPIDTLAVTLYLFPSPVRYQDPVFPTDFQLMVDGEPVFEAGGVEVNMTAGGQAVKRIDFALINIHRAMEGWGVEADGDHAVRLSVVGTGLATAAALFVYDAAEVPSGMIFNIEPENLEGYTVVDAGF